MKNLSISLTLVLIFSTLQLTSQFVQKEFMIGANNAPSLKQESATPAPADYNGDSKVDLASRINSGPNQGKFQIDYYDPAPLAPRFQMQGWDFISTSNIYGGSADYVVAGKYDTDASSDIAVYFPATKTWRIDFANNNFGSWEATYNYSSNTDIDASAIPVPADYDGDGKTDISFKTSAGKWLIDNSANGFGTIDITRTGYGGSTEKPVPADYDGDGKADLSVMTNAGVWKIDYWAGGYNGWEVTITGCGDQTDLPVPVPAKYNNDSRVDIGVKNNSGSWKILYAASTGAAYISGTVNWNVNTTNGTYAGAGAVPYPADYIGNGNTDFGFFFTSNGSWWIDDYFSFQSGYEWKSYPGKISNDFLINSLHSTDVANYTKLKNCYINTSIDVMANFSADNERDYYLTLMDNVGINSMLSDNHIYFYGDPASTNFDKSAFVNRYKNQIASNLKNRIYGINLGDEPNLIQLERVRDWSAFFHSNYEDFSQVNGAKPTFNNLLPRYGEDFDTDTEYESYLDLYKSYTPYSPFVCFDHYPFRNSTPKFITSYFYNLSIIKNKFKGRNIWSTAFSGYNPLESISKPSQVHSMFMAFCPIAYGAKGIIYFPYDNFSTYTNSIDDDNAIYNNVKNINLYLKNIVGPVVVGSTNIATLHKSNTYMNSGSGYSFSSSELLANYTGIIKDVGSSNLLIGVFAKNDTTSDKKVLSVGNYFLWIVNKDTASSVVGDSVILRGNYTGNIQVSPTAQNYINNPVTTYTNASSISYNATLNTTRFILPTLGPGEGVMVKLFSAANEAAPADYDGDKIMDISVKEYDGTWLIDYSGNGFGSWDWWGTGYGNHTSHPVPADYDGDGKADLSVKTNAQEWNIDYSGNGYGSWDILRTSYGDATAHPVPADYDGDGKADLSVKTDAEAWLINYANNGYFGWDLSLTSYGNATAHPVPADYDGDGKADLSVKTDAEAWLINYANNGFFGWDLSLTSYGNATAHPVPADYDGDGKADLSVKTNAGAWLINYSQNGFFGWDVSLSGFGNQSCIPLPGDYGGDKKADISIKYPNGDWKFDYSGNGYGSWDDIILKPLYNTPGISARPIASLSEQGYSEFSNSGCVIQENKQYNILAIYDRAGRLYKNVNQLTSLKTLKTNMHFDTGVYIVKIKIGNTICSSRIFISN